MKNKDLTFQEPKFELRKDENGKLTLVDINEEEHVKNYPATARSFQKQAAIEENPSTRQSLQISTLVFLAVKLGPSFI